MTDRQKAIEEHKNKERERNIKKEGKKIKY